MTLPGLARDEVLHRLHAERRRDDQDEGVAPDERDRRERAQRIVGRVLLQERHLHHRGIGGDEERVAVGRRLDHRVRGDRAVGAELVLHHEGLSHRLAERVGEDAGDDVGRSARGKVQQDAHRLRRVLLRHRTGARDGQHANHE